MFREGLRTKRVFHIKISSYFVMVRDVSSQIFVTNHHEMTFSTNFDSKSPKYFTSAEGSPDG
jgi:hypothetical protein